MVALSMATSSMPPFVSADLIQREAVERGFSRRGEMFSCNNLCTLANGFLGGSACAQVGRWQHVSLIMSVASN